VRGLFATIAAVNFVQWAPVASAAVAIAGAIASTVSWRRSRAERAESTRQAKIATDSAAEAAGALKQIAELQGQQHQRQQVREAVAERDPWILQRIPGADTEANLFNDTGTAKYGITVIIYARDQLWEEKKIQFVGPKRSAPINFLDISGPMRAKIAWHLVEDCSE
jgi:hypothetical protein